MFVLFSAKRLCFYFPTRLCSSFFKEQTYRVEAVAKCYG